MADWLDELVGPLWRQYPAGTVPGLPGVALLARFVDGPGGRRVVAGLLLLGDAVTAEQLRRVPIAALENGANLGSSLHQALKRLRPLRRGQLNREQFAGLVAEHYAVWARHVPHPVAGMADMWHVNPATVHGWVREARLRGLLPPARRGKGSTS